MNDEVRKIEERDESLSSEECLESAGQEECTLLERWIQKSPQSRAQEIEYIEKVGFQHQLQVTEAGDIQQVLVIDKCMFLMVINRTFPKGTENSEIPIKICLVAPNLSEFERMFPGREIPFVEKDQSGVDCLYFPAFQKEYEKYLNGQLDKVLTETLLLHAHEWVETILQAIQKEENKRTSRERNYGIRILSFLNRWRSKNVKEGLFDSRERRSKYIDGRKSVTGIVNARCKMIVLSDRAYIQIFNESQSRIQTETGGLLLGHFDNGVWYVIEASDPGINAKFYNAYHEGDDVYENHVCGVISRTYKHPLVFLGMWHRHPGSLDSFSVTDDGTNYKYAGSAGNGCISAIINYDPEFRITFYYAEQGVHQQVYYTKVDIEVGDDKIPNKEMLKVASIEDVMCRRQ